MIEKSPVPKSFLVAMLVLSNAAIAGSQLYKKPGHADAVVDCTNDSQGCRLGYFGVADSCPHPFKLAIENIETGKREQIYCDGNGLFQEIKVPVQGSEKTTTVVKEAHLDKNGRPYGKVHINPNTAGSAALVSVGENGTVVSEEHYDLAKAKAEAEAEAEVYGGLKWKYTSSPQNPQ